MYNKNKFGLPLTFLSTKDNDIKKLFTLKLLSIVKLHVLIN